MKKILTRAHAKGVLARFDIGLGAPRRERREERSECQDAKDESVGMSVEFVAAALRPSHFISTAFLCYMMIYENKKLLHNCVMSIQLLCAGNRKPRHFVG
jgi:hypothetical protein